MNATQVAHIVGTGGLVGLGYAGLVSAGSRRPPGAGLHSEDVLPVAQTTGVGAAIGAGSAAMLGIGMLGRVEPGALLRSPLVHGAALAGASFAAAASLMLAAHD